MNVDAAMKRAHAEGTPLSPGSAGPGDAPLPPSLERYARERADDGLGAAGHAGSGEAGDQLIDYHELARYARFAATSLRRRKFLALSTFALVAGATTAAVVIWPKTYHVDARLLAQTRGLMSALSNPGRAIPPDADSPTRAAGEIILRRDNLVAMIAKTDLLRRWDQTRAPILKLKDRVVTSIWGERSEEEKRDALIGLLEKRLIVSVGTEDTISIDLDWPDRQVAYELVQNSVQNFLEARRSGEMSTIAESVSILERSAAALERQVDGTFVEVQSELRSRSREERARFAASLAALRQATLVPPPAPLSNPAPAVPAPQVENPEQTRLRTALESKRQELAKLEESRRQELSDAQAQLANGLAIYTENHPAVVALRQRLASLAAEPPQLLGSRTETRNLEAQYAAAASVAAAHDEEATPTPAVHTVAGVSSPPPNRAVEPPVATPMPAPDPIGSASVDALGQTGSPLAMRLKSELAQLGDIRSRLESARIELATSAAAFKYRYDVVHPPQLPRAPIKPNVPAVVFAGLFGAFLLAGVAPAGAEIIAGRRPNPPSTERRIMPAATVSAIRSPRY